MKEITFPLSLLQQLVLRPNTTPLQQDYVQVGRTHTRKFQGELPAAILLLSWSSGDTPQRLHRVTLRAVSVETTYTQIPRLKGKESIIGRTRVSQEGAA